MSEQIVATSDTAAMPAAVDMSHMKSNLYCVQCNRLLQDAVEVACCHALYCAACVPAGIPSSSAEPTTTSSTTAASPGTCATTNCDAFPVCTNCGREILTAPTPNHPVRRLVASIPIPCTQEGCPEIVAAGLMSVHIASDCDYASVLCKYYSRGCAAALLRKDLLEHETQYCVFRDVSCPQGCGARALQWRELTTHFEDTCPKSLRECPVKCGALVERTSLSDHLNSCPLRPVYCPYIAFGCTLHRPLRTRDMEEHMACSLHSHLRGEKHLCRCRVDDQTHVDVCRVTRGGVIGTATVRCRAVGGGRNIQACAVVRLTLLAARLTVLLPTRTGSTASSPTAGCRTSPCLLLTQWRTVGMVASFNSSSHYGQWTTPRCRHNVVND